MSVGSAASEGSTGEVGPCLLQFLMVRACLGYGGSPLSSVFVPSICEFL